MNLIRRKHEQYVNKSIAYTMVEVIMIQHNMNTTKQMKREEMELDIISIVIL